MTIETNVIKIKLFLMKHNPTKGHIPTKFYGWTSADKLV